MRGKVKAEMHSEGWNEISTGVTMIALRKPDRDGVCKQRETFHKKLFYFI